MRQGEDGEEDKVRTDPLLLVGGMEAKKPSMYYRKLWQLITGVNLKAQKRSFSLILIVSRKLCKKGH